MGEELFVLGESFLGDLVSLLLGVLDDSLSAESLLSDESLDLGGLVESLVATLDFTGNNVLADIVLLLVEGEGLDDVVATLGAESVGALDVGDSSDFAVTSLNNTEEDGRDVGVENATADGLTLALTGTGGVVASCT